MLSLARTLLACSLALLCLGEDLVITHKPNYITLDDKVDTIKASEIQQVLSALHGFTLHSELNFHGLYASSPFNQPKASALLTLYGGDAVTKHLTGSKLNLKPDDVYVPVTKLKHHLHSFFHDSSNIVEIGHETKIGDFEGLLEALDDSPKQVMSTMNELYSGGKLNLTDPEIANLYRQSALIIQSLRLVSKSGAGQADLYSYELHVPTMKNSDSQNDVNNLVISLVDKMNGLMKEMYGDDYLVLALSMPESSIVKTRKTRSLLQTSEGTPPPKPDDINLAEAWTEDYPVIFHIILWLTVFLIITTIFVTHGMMTMDPGNDSIIYRMTTTRLKKD